MKSLMISWYGLVLQKLKHLSLLSWSTKSQCSIKDEYFFHTKVPKKRFFLVFFKYFAFFWLDREKTRSHHLILNDAVFEAEWREFHPTKKEVTDNYLLYMIFGRIECNCNVSVRSEVGEVGREVYFLYCAHGAVIWNKSKI